MSPRLRRRGYLSAAGSMIGATSGCSGIRVPMGGRVEIDVAGGRWPMHGHDVANTGQSPDSPGPTSDVALGWKADVADSLNSSATVADGRLFVGGGRGCTAIGATTGEVDWKLETGAPVWGEPAVAGQHVFVAAADGYVYAVEASTGETAWSRDLETSAVPAPTVTSGTVYAATDAGTVFALSGEDGVPRWTADLPDAVRTAPAVDGGTLFVADQSSAVYAIERETGTVEWERSLRRAPAIPLAVGSGALYASHLDGLSALETSTGEERWRHDVSGNAIGVALGPDGLYLSVARSSDGTQGRLRSIRRSDGTERWSVSLGDATVNPPSMGTTTLYTDVGRGSDGQSGGVRSLQGRDGTENWAFEVDGTVVGAPVIAGDAAFVATADGTVYGLTTPE